MNLRDEIIKHLKKEGYKAGYLWKPMNYYSGFLVNYPFYSSHTNSEFIKIMQYFCDLGYFNTEPFSIDYVSYRLTEKGYVELIKK